jgi:hypothetical protein
MRKSFEVLVPLRWAMKTPWWRRLRLADGLPTFFIALQGYGTVTGPLVASFVMPLLANSRNS